VTLAISVGDIKMKKFSNDKDINGIVVALTKQGWRCRFGKKHTVIISPDGFRVAVPSTPSDRRAFHNFNRDLKHITRKGVSHAI
jgi:hypothetical protein